MDLLGGVSMENVEKKWYVVNTYSGHEDKVKEKLDMRINSMDMQENIFRVIVPVRKEVEIVEISDVRGPAAVAQKLYKETEESKAQREKQLEQIKINALLAPHPDEKPNKKERRALISMKYGW